MEEVDNLDEWPEEPTAGKSKCGAKTVMSAVDATTGDVIGEVVIDGNQEGKSNLVEEESGDKQEKASMADKHVANTADSAPVKDEAQVSGDDSKEESEIDDVEPGDEGPIVGDTNDNKDNEPEDDNNEAKGGGDESASSKGNSDGEKSEVSSISGGEEEEEGPGDKDASVNTDDKDNDDEHHDPDFDANNLEDGEGNPQSGDEVDPLHVDDFGQDGDMEKEFCDEVQLSPVHHVSQDPIIAGSLGGTTDQVCSRFSKLKSNVKFMLQIVVFQLVDKHDKRPRTLRRLHDFLPKTADNIPDPNTEKLAFATMVINIRSKVTLATDNRRFSCQHRTFVAWKKCLERCVSYNIFSRFAGNGLLSGHWRRV